VLGYLDVPHVKRVTNRRVPRENREFQLIQELDDHRTQVHYSRSWKKLQVSDSILASLTRVPTANIKEVHNFVSCDILSDNYDMFVIGDPENHQVR